MNPFEVRIGRDLFRARNHLYASSSGEDQLKLMMKEFISSRVSLYELAPRRAEERGNESSAISRASRLEVAGDEGNQGRLNLLGAATWESNHGGRPRSR